MWAAATFGTLGLLVLLGLVPDHPGNLTERAVVRIDIALLVLFPYLLFRFTTAFRRPERDVANALFVLTAILIVWTFALPRIPQPDEPRPLSLTLYVIVFIIHWTVLSIVSARRLWLAGSEQPTVSRRRMHLLSIASAGLIVAILLLLPSSDQDSATSLASSILGTLSACAFLLGFAPPPIIRLWWRTPETARMQQAIASLVAFSESQEELPGASRAAAAIVARAPWRSGTPTAVIGSWNVPEDARASLGPGARPDDLARRRARRAGHSRRQPSSLDLAYAPFFGDEELALLRASRGHSLALDNVNLFRAEHKLRVELERANEVKSNSSRSPHTSCAHR